MGVTGGLGVPASPLRVVLGVGAAAGIGAGFGWGFGKGVVVSDTDWATVKGSYRY